MASVFLVIILMKQGAKLMKRLGFSKKVNQIVLIVGDILLCVILIGTLSYMFFAPNENGESMLQVLAKDSVDHGDLSGKLPVTLDDLVDPELYADKRTEYSQDQKEYSTCFMSQLKVSERITVDRDEQEWTLSYDVLKVNLPFLYERCRLEYMKEYSYIEELGEGYQEEDASLWSADRVYRWYYEEGNPADKWVICRGDYIVKLELNWEPTQEQRAWMMEQLSNMS